MNKIIVALVCLCHIHMAWGGNDTTPKKSDANIIGHVIDKKTGKHLPHVDIIIKGTTIGTITDATGHYYLKNLPEGDFTLMFKSVGYKTIERKVKLISHKTIEENFEAEEDAISLNDIVVSANRSETNRKLSPSLVNILDTKMLEKTSSASLADGLDFQPGVRVETNCQNCGFSQVRINGLDGPYSQILIDSRPVFNGLTSVYGLEQIPANIIERVEVIRGGGSALFGSSAIAGTINVITKEPTRNSATIAHSLTMTGGKRPDNNTTMNLSLVTDDSKAGIYIYGQNRYRAGYDHNNDGFTELPQIKSKTIGFHSYLKTSDHSKLSLEYHTINEFRRGGDSLNIPPHDANIAEQIEHNINAGSLNFDISSTDLKHKLNLYTSTQYTQRQSYYGAHKDPNAYGRTNELAFIGGAQYIRHWDNLFFMPADLTGGLEFNFNKLNDLMPLYNVSMSQTIRNYALFLQNEWKNEKWSILIGGRLDKHNKINHVIFSPRINLRYTPCEHTTMRLSYASGFRAPQTFNEDLHLEAIGEGKQIIVVNDPNLKPERSQSLSFSTDFYYQFGAVKTNFLAEVFYTDLNNVFYKVPGASSGQEAEIKIRKNEKGATVAGVNLEGKMSYAWLQLQAGATLQRSRYKVLPASWSENPNVPITKKLFRSPDVYGYFTSTFTPVKRLGLSLTGTYTGGMLVKYYGKETSENRNVKTTDFFDMHTKLTYDIPLSEELTLQLNCGVKNIFNAYQKDLEKGPDRDATYVYGPRLPRSYFVGFKVTY